MLRKFLIVLALIPVVTSRPLESAPAPFLIFGEASWYGRHDLTDPWEHRVTASGEPFDENSLSCAMRQRDFGKFYRVTNLANGKSVVVKHNDFGPGRKWTDPRTGITYDLSRRVIDLSKGAFTRIADPGQGLIKRVKVEKVRD